MVVVVVVVVAARRWLYTTERGWGERGLEGSQVHTTYQKPVALKSLNSMRLVNTSVRGDDTVPMEWEENQVNLVRRGGRSPDGNNRTNDGSEAGSINSDRLPGVAMPWILCGRENLSLICWRCGFSGLPVLRWTADWLIQPQLLGSV